MTTLIGFIFDVSKTMQKFYDDLCLQNYSFQTSPESLIEIINNIVDNLRVDFFALLCGSQNVEISDFLLLLKITISCLSEIKENIKDPKAKFIELMQNYGSIRLKDNLFEGYNDYRGTLGLVCGLISGGLIGEKDNDLGKKFYESFIKNNFVFNLLFKTFFNSKNSEVNILNIIENLECNQIFFNKIFDIMKKNTNFQKEKYEKIGSFEIKVMITEAINLIQNIIPNIQKKDKHFNFINYLSKNIYGRTPLKEAFQKALNFFSKDINQYNRKILIILSNGENEDEESFEHVIKESEKNKIFIVGCYIGTKVCSKKNTLYDDESSKNDIKDINAKRLFKICSKINCDNKVFRFFLRKGCTVPSSGYCRLFIALNNVETIYEFVKLINEFLNCGNFDYYFNGLIDVIGSFPFTSYINYYTNYIFLSKKQIFGT